MLEKEYAVPSEMLWEIWNERLNRINSDIKEFRITSIAVSTIIWSFILMAKWLVISDNIASIVVMTLALSGTLWSMCYVYTLLPHKTDYLDEVPMKYHQSDFMDNDSYAMLLKDLEKTTFMMSRRLYLLRKLMAMAVMMTIMSIFTLTIATKVVL